MYCADDDGTAGGELMMTIDLVIPFVLAVIALLVIIGAQAESNGESAAVAVFLAISASVFMFVFACGVNALLELIGK